MPKKRVYKYILPNPSDVFIMLLPMGAEILDFQVQKDMPCFWAFVDPDLKNEVRKFRCVCTGDPIEQTIRKHHGTCQHLSGNEVLHLFEIFPDEEDLKS